MTDSALALAPLATTAAARRLRILFIASAHNSLSQRVMVALTELGHRVEVEVVGSAAAIEAAVTRHRPELVVCPTRMAIPDAVRRDHRCLVFDIGSLEEAIELQASASTVRVLDANDGDVWATRTFRTREASRTSLYRHELRRAATEAVVEAVTKVAVGETSGDPVDEDARATTRTPQRQRAIDWSRHTTATIIRRIRAAEGHPGVLDGEFHLFGAHREYRLRGAPGQIIAQRDGAICRATVDGAVWISHLKRVGHFKLPATRALHLAGHKLTAPIQGDGFKEITYEERAGVGYLHFDFYNGAMSTGQCQRLLVAYREARDRDTRAIVLMGGRDCFSNGIHLHVIEAADDPRTESWRNLIAMNDLVKEIIETDDRLVISALTGDAAAGGVALALAADHVLAREDVVLNPAHTEGVYSTYLLPRRIGSRPPAKTPIGAQQAVQLGLLDMAVGRTAQAFGAEVRRVADTLAHGPHADDRLLAKRRARVWDEARKPLAAYREEELARCHDCFFAGDTYHEARRRFVYKVPID